MTAGDRDYVRRLGEVLRQRDPETLRRFLVEQAERFGDERQVADVRDKPADELAMLLHRMILARSDLADLHPASQRWLNDHGAGPAPGARSGRARSSGEGGQARRRGDRSRGDDGEPRGDGGRPHGERPPRPARPPRRGGRPHGPRDSGDAGPPRQF